MASKNKQKRGHITESSSDDEENFQSETSSISITYWPEFLLIQPEGEHKLYDNPFQTAKIIKAFGGEVKAVKRLRNGDILVHCATRSQTINLLKLKTFAGVPCKVVPHRSLNSSKGIIRDRQRCLQSMSEDALTSELSEQGVIQVKRFTAKTSAGIVPTNTYLITFSCASLPREIKAGYNIIKVDIFIPNPLRCYKCQTYGHGASKCTRKPICHRCGSDGHEGSECKEAPCCVNCKGKHMASSKDCPVWIRESEICKVKVTQTISYPEARHNHLLVVLGLQLHMLLLLPRPV